MLVRKRSQMDNRKVRYAAAHAMVCRRMTERRAYLLPQRYFGFTFLFLADGNQAQQLQSRVHIC